MKRNMSKFLVVVMLVTIFISIPNTLFANEESIGSEDLEISSHAPHKIWVSGVRKWSVVEYNVYHEVVRHGSLYRGYLDLVYVEGITGIYEGYLYRTNGDGPVPIPTKLELEQE